MNEVYVSTGVETDGPIPGVKGAAWKTHLLGYSAAFDFMFVYWYLICLADESPFSHSAVDIKTYAMTLLRKGYPECAKRNLPKRWFGKLPHTRRHLVKSYFDYYHRPRTHLSLVKNVPEPRAKQPPELGAVV